MALAVSSHIAAMLALAVAVARPAHGASRALAPAGNMAGDVDGGSDGERHAEQWIHGDAPVWTDDGIAEGSGRNAHHIYNQRGQSLCTCGADATVQRQFRFSLRSGRSHGRVGADWSAGRAATPSAGTADVVPRRAHLLRIDVCCLASLKAT